MSLTPCPACSKNLSPQATSCPHCGHPLKQANAEAQPKQKTKRKSKEVSGGIGCVTMLSILGGVAGLGYLVLAGSDPGDPCGTKTEAMISGYTAAQLSMKRKLVAPTSADFQPPQYAEVQKIKCGQWRIRSYVDSQNGFGAQIRTYFTGVVAKQSNGVWMVQTISTE